MRNTASLGLAARQHVPRVLVIVLTLACGEADRAPPPGMADEDAPCAGGAATVDVDEEQMPDVNCPESERQLLCYGSWAAHCNADGKLLDLVNCRAEGLVCAAKKCDSAEQCTGCRQCVPGSARCGEEGERFECEEDGSGYAMVEVCDEAAGERCNLTAGTCEDLCAAAERDASYIGCDYWAVSTRNSQLEFTEIDADGLCRPFSFAVVVANPQGVDAHVRVDSPGGHNQMRTVKAGKTRTIELPCAPELLGADPGATVTEEELLAGLLDNAFTVRASDAAHHITSDVPVTVYQFNPLEFRAEVDGERVFSHTNDASLLLPTHALTGNYVVMSVPTLLHQLNPPRSEPDAEPVQYSGPGFVTLVGVESEPVEVEIHSSAWTMPSEDREFPMLGPGDTYTFTIAPGEVVQITSQTPSECIGDPLDPIGRGVTLTYCEVPKQFDLTGTRISAQGKVGVIAGHDCAFLPYNRWACDHLEETMFPVEAWGRDIVIGVSQAALCQTEIPNAIRVLSDTDDNRVNFVPEVHEPIVLQRGEYVDVEITQDVRVSGSGAILVGQFLLGQDYEGRDTAGSFGKGDPALSLGIPFEQWRNNYAFVAPETFTENYVNVIGGERQLILLDGRALTGFTPIEGTNLSIAKVGLRSGQHQMRSMENFGIVVYGYATYTSYMVPGGLDLNRINRPD